MRVIGRTKPKGAMKVKGGRLGVLVAPAAPSGADPRPADAAVAVPFQSGVEGVRGMSPFLSSLPPASWVPGALDGPSLLACTQGGAGPGLVM